MRRLFTLHCFIVLIAFGLLTACDSNKQKSPDQVHSVTLSKWLAGAAEAGFERAINPRTFIFPEDHWSHDSFKIEWWYLTGNLSTEKTGQGNSFNAEKEFGYQVTFFRIGLAPNSSSEKTKQPSAWASQNIWMAHIALSDISAIKHYQDERLSRGAAGLAGIQKEPFKIWLEDWQILGANESKNNGEFPWNVHIKNNDFSLDFKITPEKPVVLQGENGLSQKSQELGNASYYYSFTRLNTRGTIKISGRKYDVSGWSWLDREWSTSALGKKQAGWNWFSLQLDDGTDLMYYQLLNNDGKTNPLSSGKWVNKDGSYLSLVNDQVQLEPLKYWHSKTGKKYVTEWKMIIPGKNIVWRIKAMLDNQEMLTTVQYWEGAVRVLDAKSGKPVGKGYLEMTGY